MRYALSLLQGNPQKARESPKRLKALYPDWQPGILVRDYFRWVKLCVGGVVVSDYFSYAASLWAGSDGPYL